MGEDSDDFRESVGLEDVEELEGFLEDEGEGDEDGEERGGRWERETVMNRGGRRGKNREEGKGGKEEGELEEQRVKGRRNDEPSRTRTIHQS